MKIRKEFSIEMAHTVKNCSSERCALSIHGHSARIEVFLESNHLDNADMVYDFGLMKGTISQFIDAMDHCYVIGKDDSEKFREFIRTNCKRYIILPFNPSAEMLSLYFMHYINVILSRTIMVNSEDSPRCTGVRYHETASGWAECNLEDYNRLWKDEWDKDIAVSEDIAKGWSPDLYNIIFKDMPATNIQPVTKQ